MIDFEATVLNPEEDRRTIDPYTDLASGIVFCTVDTSADGVVGIVINSTTSACVEPIDANQKLGTGVQSTQGSTVGQASFAIPADFPTPLAAPATVAVDFQTALSMTVRLRLFDANDQEVGSSVELAAPAAGKCGLAGPLRARKTVTAVSTAPVAYAIMDLGTATGQVEVTVVVRPFGPVSQAIPV